MAEDIGNSVGCRMTNVEKLPRTLVEAVREQRAVLFLGAGASMEAKSPSGQRPPNGKQLTALLVKRFFGESLVPLRQARLGLVVGVAGVGGGDD
jgi:hypothetical protein